ncbi:MAG: DUF4242 domain-containing protein [Chloroflexi bacterium]|nr:DUF4242 domain-containing protein [Chloroflexota bacterium]MCH8350895.1 DUF4242 domain-containing protein [Chloroflexota bacterium]MCI0781556.1 DUF4242 domain-containing protein [Chloroflexota bacterium]MCI0785411.1 DUF4242 domain-containing protein [Chloroflexota bacterium]MCI0792779.1 DUF4242 domain-containing protein [Chloroflexota bacterium]
MPMFLIERNFAEQLQFDKEIVDHIVEVNTDMGVNWLFSFLSADKKKTYCLYEAPNAESIRENASRLGLPADVVVEVTDVNAAMFA